MQEHRSASYMVEAYYRQGHDHVYLLCTTAVSNRNGGLPGFWEVWILPGSRVHDILPYHYIKNGYAECIGRLSAVDPSSQSYASMREYIARNNPGQRYRHWVGYSQQHRTLDDMWYAVDLYWQTPSMLYQELWVWYILIDCNEPSQYHRARIVYHNGMRDMGPEEDEPPPGMPGVSRINRIAAHISRI